VAFLESEKLADVGASNRLRKHAHYVGNPRRLLASTFRPPVQPHGASDSFARTCDVDRAEAALIALAGLMRKGQTNV
jgi:hypothetical protein